MVSMDTGHPHRAFLFLSKEVEVRLRPRVGSVLALANGLAIWDIAGVGEGHQEFSMQARNCKASCWVTLFDHHMLWVEVLCGLQSCKWRVGRLPEHPNILGLQCILSVFIK